MKRISWIAIILLITIITAQGDTIPCITVNKIIEIRNFCNDSTIYIKNKFSGQYIHYNDKDLIVNTINLIKLPGINEYSDVTMEYDNYKQNRKYFWMTFEGGLGLMVLSPVLSAPISYYTKRNVVLWPYFLLGGYGIFMTSIVFELKSENNMLKLVWKLNNDRIMDKLLNNKCQ